MYRLLFLIVFIAACKPDQKKLLLSAEQLAKTNPEKAIVAAKEVYQLSKENKNYKDGVSAALLLSSIYSNASNYKMAAYYDSVSVNFARLTNDSLLLQKAILSYANTLKDMNNTEALEKVLQKDSAMFAWLQNAETCKWYQLKGDCQFRQMNNDGALLNFKAGLPLAIKLNDTNKAMIFRVLIAKTYLYKGNSDSLELAYQAFDYFKQTNRYVAASNAAYVLGFSFQTSFNMKQALAYYKEALNYAWKGNDTSFAAQYQINVADAYMGQNQLDSAEQVLMDSQRFYERVDDQVGLIQCYLRLAPIYTEINQPELATLFFNKAEAINKDLKSVGMETAINQLKAVMYAKYKNYKMADSLYTATERLFAKHGDKDLLSYAVTKLKEGKLYTNEEVSRADSVYNNGSENKLGTDTGRHISDDELEKLTKMNMYTGSNKTEDSTILARSSKLVLSLEEQYRTKIKDDSLKLQAQQAIIAKKEIKTKNITIAAASILLVLVAAGLLLQSHYRRRAESDKAKIELLQNEIHHRVKNNLAVINRLVEVAGKNSVEDAPLITLKTRIKSIELLHNHLYSNEAKTGNISLQSYFEDLCLAIAATFQTAKDIKIKVQAPTEVDSTIAEKLGLILNELVTNSFKYAFENKDKGAITVTAKPGGGQLNITVQDDGVGMPAEKSIKSYGMKLIKGLSNELNGKFNFQNSGGTYFQLSIPVNA